MILPVGHYGGARPDGGHVVRVGWRLNQLSGDEFGVWVLAHGLTEDIGIEDAPRIQQDLLARGVLAVAEGEEFAQRYRMHPLYVGLGNAPDRLEGHAVGLPGVGAAAILDPGPYELWQWGGVAPSLWHMCELRAVVAAELGQPVERGAALGQVLDDLAVLLRYGCAYLDVVGAGEVEG